MMSEEVAWVPEKVVSSLSLSPWDCVCVYVCHSACLFFISVSLSHMCQLFLIMAYLFPSLVDLILPSVGRSYSSLQLEQSSLP